MTFEGFLRSLGLRPRAIRPSGRWTRCGTEAKPKSWNGAYRLAPDGLVGWGQDWATHSEPVIWWADGASGLPAIDPAALRRAQADHEHMQRTATKRAQEFYAACRPLRDSHPYLEAHGLDMTGCHGLKVDKDGWLVVPAFSGRQIATVQRISPEGEKKFWYGAPVGGSWHTIGVKPPWALTVLCEGLATGLAVYAALLNSGSRGRVIVLWNTGNMEKAATYVSGMRVIAADNDHETICQTHQKEGLTKTFEPWDERPHWCRCNPGRHTAEKVAAATGCGFVFPTGIKGTDWADYRQEKRRERLEKARSSHTTRGQIERAVDAEITRELLRHAKYVAPKTKAVG